MYSPSFLNSEDDYYNYSAYQYEECTEKSESSDSKLDLAEHLPLEEKPAVTFDTGSSYAGQWSAIGMEGYGSYTLFTGSRYEGSMKDGMFHGPGTLYFPNKTRMEGIWENGQLENYSYFYTDGMQYGPYCEMPDRRFAVEHREGLQPAGRSYITTEYPGRKIPDGFYDTIDGFYNPDTKCVVDTENLNRIIRIPSTEECDWILENCRVSTERHVGHRPDLYENWTELETHP